MIGKRIQIAKRLCCNSAISRWRAIALLVPVVWLCVSVSAASAQNPVRGVIRPVPGSKPLAIRTPTLYQSPRGNPNVSMMPSNFDRGRGRHGHHGHYAPNLGPVYTYPGYWSGYYGYPYYGYPYYGYGYAVTGVGLTVGYANGNTAISVGFPYQTSYYGGFVPNGWWGTYPYGYAPYRYRRINRFSGGFFSPMSAVDGGFLASPLLTERDAVSVDESIPKKPEPAERVESSRDSVSANEGGFLEQPPRLSSVSDRRRAMGLVLEADRAAAKGDDDKAMSFSRTAVKLAPDLAEGHLRFALALNGAGSFDKAATEMKTAIDYKPVLANGQQFTLDDWYGSRSDAKQQVLDEMANAALASPDATRLLFNLGLMLRLDGQTEWGNSMLKKVADQDPTLAASVMQVLELDSDKSDAEQEPALRLVR